VDRSISSQLLRSSGRSAGLSIPVASLSEREAEVVRLLAQGMTTKEIAQQLAFRSGWLEP